MPRSLTLYLSDLLTSGDQIFKFTDGMDYAQYEANDTVCAAVERKFGVIGEALSQMRQHYPDFMQKIDDSRKSVDFRKYLIHQYSTVDNEAVWSAIKSKLPDFREQIIQLQAEIAATPEQA